MSSPITPSSSDQNGIEETNPVYSNEDSPLDESYNEDEQDFPEVCYCVPNAVYAVLYKTISVTMLIIGVVMLFRESDRMFGFVLLATAIAFNWIFGYLSVLPIFFPVKLSVSKNGITCNQISSNTLLWNSISNIENDISLVRVHSSPIWAITKINITLKHGEKHKLRLYFSDENDAQECCLTIQTYFRRFQ